MVRNFKCLDNNLFILFTLKQYHTKYFYTLFYLMMNIILTQLFQDKSLIDLIELYVNLKILKLYLNAPSKTHVSRIVRIYVCNFFKYVIILTFYCLVECSLFGVK